MKLLKIGRGSGCNIVLHSPNVSSLHAELVLLDNGDIFIEDKGSTNGTFVSNQQLRPNVETKIFRGDLVRLADTELQWQLVPQVKTGGYKAIYNIGSSLRNDVQLTTQFGSRYHATLFIDNQGKATLVDNGSRNGTEVNGVRIVKDKPVAIKRGDKVVCGDEDITDKIKPLLPAGVNVPLIAGIAAAVALIVAGIIFVPKLFGGGGDNVEPTPITASTDSASTSTDATPVGLTTDITKIRSSVVYVTAKFHLTCRFEPQLISNDVWSRLNMKGNPGEFPFSSSFFQQGEYTATAFFLDKEGNLATNRHVALPWQYLDGNVVRNYLLVWDKCAQLIREIPAGRGADAAFRYNENLTDNNARIMWRAIKEQAAASGNTDRNSINAIIRQFKTAKPQVGGYIEYICVGYPGRNYTHVDEYERCYVRSVSDSEDRDVAILQLNNKKTPDEVQYVFSPSNFFTGQLEPGKDQLTWVGYPRGESWNLENSSLEPTIRETRVTKIPTGYSFEFDSEAQGGSSGSPIFNSKTGQLVGVLWGGRTAGTTYGFACQAKWLQKLYQEMP